MAQGHSAVSVATRPCGVKKEASRISKAIPGALQGFQEQEIAHPAPTSYDAECVTKEIDSGCPSLLSPTNNYNTMKGKTYSAP